MKLVPPDRAKESPGCLTVKIIIGDNTIKNEAKPKHIFRQLFSTNRDEEVIKTLTPG